MDQKVTQSSGSQSGEISNETRITMQVVEENRRKLYEASRMGSIQSFNALIEEDPYIVRKVLISTSNVESPLHVSVSYGHLGFTRLLLDQNPELATELDPLQRTPLHVASANGHVDIVRALLEKNISACLTRDLDGLIPLHSAVISGQIEIMKELIKARPQSVWMKLNNGQTALHLCAKDNHLEAIKSLTEVLKIYNDEEFMNATDNNGNTVLDLSLMLRQIEIVRYLLSFPGIKTGTSILNNCATSSNAITKGSSCGSSTHRIEDVPSGREEHCRESYASAAKRKLKSWWEKHLTYKGDWLQEVQGTMMLVATVIATVTFQGAINPPGGVWQQDIPFGNNTTIHRPTPSLHGVGNNRTSNYIAGTAVMAYSTSNELGYTLYLITNSISFLASICVILFIIGRLPLKNRICAWLLTITMCVSVASLTLSYIIGIRMVNNSFENSLILSATYRIARYILYGMTGVVVLSSLIIPSIALVVKLLIWVVKLHVWGLKRLFHTFILHTAPIASATT